VAVASSEFICKLKIQDQSIHQDKFNKSYLQNRFNECEAYLKRNVKGRLYSGNEALIKLQGCWLISWERNLNNGITVLVSANEKGGALCLLGP